MTAFEVLALPGTKICLHMCFPRCVYACLDLRVKIRVHEGDDKVMIACG